MAGPNDGTAMPTAEFVFRRPHRPRAIILTKAHGIWASTDTTILRRNLPRRGRGEQRFFMYTTSALAEDVLVQSTAVGTGPLTPTLASSHPRYCASHRQAIVRLVGVN